MKRLIQFIKIIIILIPLIIFGWIINKQFVPFGKLVIEHDFYNESMFISDLYPEIRTSKRESDGEKYYKKIHEDGVYFDLTLPRLFEKATVQIKFDSANPIFDIGAQKEKDKWVFETIPLENKMIDQLDWLEIRKDGLSLFQKNKEYELIDNFIKDPPLNKKIAKYYFDGFNKDIKFADYIKSNKSFEINNTLRGSHLIYTYIKEEDLNFIFSVQDINRSWDEDPININIYKNSTGERIHTETIEDDGEVAASGKITDIREVNIKKSGLEEGIYKIELNFSDDLLTRKIETKQKLLIFERRLFIADSKEYLPDYSNKVTRFYSSGSKLTVNTAHPESLQTLKINNRDYKIQEIDLKHVLGKDELKSEGLSEILSSKSDLLFESDGYFVFSLDSLFYPEPVNIVKLNSETNLDEVDYVIAEYNEPESIDNDWKIASAEFDLSQLYINEESKVKFILSAPGLRDNEAEIKINEIKIILEKEPITISNLIPRLKNLTKKIIDN